MHALIVADIEGSWNVYNLTDEEQERNKDSVTKEVEVCILALQENGITDITVCDSHDRGDSVCSKMLNSRNVVRVSQLTTLITHQQMKYDFVILLGYHGKNNSGGILEHTLRPDVRKVWLQNEVEIGEVELLCRWFGHYKIPVILVIGDVEAVREGNYFNPYRYGCSVKGSPYANSAKNAKLLYSKIAKSVEMALTVEFWACIAHDNDPVYIEFEGYEENISTLNQRQYIGERTLRYDNCHSLMLDMGCFVEKLNGFLYQNQKANAKFVKEMRDMTKIVSREMVTDTNILTLMSKDSTWLNAADRKKISSYFLGLKEQIEGDME